VVVFQLGKEYLQSEEEVVEEHYRWKVVAVVAVPLHSLTVEEVVVVVHHLVEEVAEVAPLLLVEEVEVVVHPCLEEVEVVVVVLPFLVEVAVAVEVAVEPP